MKKMTNSRFGIGIFFFFLSFFIGVLGLPLNSALDSKKDLPFCEQKKCDQEYKTNKWTDPSHAEKIINHSHSGFLDHRPQNPLKFGGFWSLWLFFLWGLPATNGR